MTAATLGKPFTLKGATHFCKNPAIGTAGGSTSFRSLVENWTANRHAISESDPDFEQFRVEALREADRHLFLGVSNYRRFKDLLLESSASWGWVTLYYSSYHAATAILGCLGVSVHTGHESYRGALIDVEREAAGFQRFRVQKGPVIGPNKLHGSHANFWDIYYHYVAPFKTTFPPAIRGAADPVRKIRTWQIDERNRVNYDSYEAFKVCSGVRAAFLASSFPDCLKVQDPAFSDQHRATVSLLDAALWIAKTANLRTDALDALSGGGSRRQTLEATVRRARYPFPAGTPLLRAAAPNANGESIHV
jgi:hypothetical protein